MKKTRALDKFPEFVHCCVKSLIKASELMDKKQKGFLTFSPAFGYDDPFTILALLRVFLAIKKGLIPFPKIDEGDFDKFSLKLQEKAKEVVKNATSYPRDADKALCFDGDVIIPGGQNPRPHPYVLSRIVRLRNVLEKCGVPVEINLELVKQYLTERLHVHLSYARSPGTPFDLAELIFALDGLLECEKSGVPSTIVDRVFETIKQRASNLSSLHISTIPMVVSSVSYLYLPASEEAAISLLHVCYALDQETPGMEYFGKYVDLFNIYAELSIQQMNKGKTSEKIEEEEIEFAGWSDEHVGLFDRIHLYHTAHRLIFLGGYEIALRRYFARSLLEQSKLLAVAPPSMDKKIVEKIRRETKQNEASPSSQTHQQSSALKPSAYWLKDWEENEPLKSLKEDVRYRVYRRIRKEFLEPLESGNADDRRYSMLLYGPPGTGKTSIGKKISEALGWKYISVSPSDFALLGEAGVEARAKDIFQALEEQDSTIILFDEIDRLILDRDSENYRTQSDIFQLMTPSMLTKLTSLRDKKNIIFLIATNYFERIDRAITRPGRIDAHLLVLPPDSHQRERLFLKILKEKKLGFEISASELLAVVKNSVLATWGELKGIVDSSIHQWRAKAASSAFGSYEDKKDFIAFLFREAEQTRFTINLLSYEKRLKASGEKPYEEFLLLVYLVDESKLGFSTEETQLIKQVTRETRKNLRDIVREDHMGKLIKDMIKRNGWI
jgi:SpoVK/Ycf46/Vps4 family AAA+-type ATPase